MLYTLMPHTGTVPSASCMEKNALRLQIRSCVRIAEALLNKDDRKRYHPSVQMWDGYLPCLLTHADWCCTRYLEKTSKTHKEAGNVRRMLDTVMRSLPVDRHVRAEACREPSWMGTPLLHSMARAVLVNRVSKAYKRKFRGMVGAVRAPSDPAWPVTAGNVVTAGKKTYILMRVGSKEWKKLRCDVDPTTRLSKRFKFGSTVGRFLLL